MPVTTPDLARGQQDLRPVALCPGDDCDAPLVGTFHWAGFEFYCLDCGRHVPYFGPDLGKPVFELLERMEAYQAEWAEHAGRRLLTPDARRTDCVRCQAGTSCHIDHATDDERAAHRAALDWIAARIRVSA
jgi:hypothetical protein